MPLLVGIDPGWSSGRRSTGVAVTDGRTLIREHTTADHASRLEALAYRPGLAPRITMLAIDAPVLPGRWIHYARRGCEQVLVRGLFQKRCKPGESHVRGTGRALRRAGCETARKFAAHVDGAALAAAFPQVQPGRNVVEAFPTAFLAVLLPDAAFQPPIRRGQRSDALFQRCLASGAFDRLERELPTGAPALWSAVGSGAVQDHDERAAVVCLMTALGVCGGRYLAVGDPGGGYIFLPPWSLWWGWARAALEASRRRETVRGPVEVWIDGKTFGPTDALPR